MSLSINTFTAIKLFGSDVDFGAEVFNPLVVVVAITAGWTQSLDFCTPFDLAF